MNKVLRKQGNNTRSKIYDFIVEFITTNGYSPTIMEICRGTGIRSSATVHSHLDILEQLGLIQTKDFKPRTISVTGYNFTKGE